MTVASMHYFEPNFVNEALVVLDRYGARARLLAGGTRLVPTLRGHREDAVALVNLKRIPTLAATIVGDGSVKIGALVTAAEILRSAEIGANAPLLAMAAQSMGSTQLRALATIGGNICSGDPASDLTVALLASDAVCVIASLERGERRVLLKDSLTPGGTVFAPDELLTNIDVPVRNTRVAYRKMQTRHAFEMAIVAVAVAVERDGDRVTAARIALAGAGPICLRAAHAERAALANQSGGNGNAWAQRAAAAAAHDDAEPLDDERAS